MVLANRESYESEESKDLIIVAGDISIRSEITKDLELTHTLIKINRKPEIEKIFRMIFLKELQRISL